MAERRTVQTFCRLMAWLCVAGMILIPALAVSVWLLPGLAGNVTLNVARADVDASSLGPAQRLLGLAVSLMLAGVQVAALWFLRQAFVEGGRGVWFSLRAVRSFRRFAWLTLILVPLNVAQDSAMSVITTMNNPAGERMLSIGFGSDNFRALFTALVMLFVAHMFAAGREVDEENAAFI